MTDQIAYSAFKDMKSLIFYTLLFIYTLTNQAIAFDILPVKIPRPEGQMRGRVFVVDARDKESCLEFYSALHPSLKLIQPNLDLQMLCRQDVSSPYNLLFFLETLTLPNFPTAESEGEIAGVLSVQADQPPLWFSPPYLQSWKRADLSFYLSIASIQPTDLSIWLQNLPQWPSDGSAYAVVMPLNPLAIKNHMLLPASIGTMLFYFNSYSPILRSDLPRILAQPEFVHQVTTLYVNKILQLFADPIWQSAVKKSPSSPEDQGSYVRPSIGPAEVDLKYKKKGEIDPDLGGIYRKKDVWQINLRFSY